MSEPSAPSVDRPALGILLVHGIGEQPEGDTLLGFGEPIVRWLRRWFESSGAPALDRSSIREVGASLRPSREMKAEPAHAELAIRAPDGSGRRVEQRWLVAESWWGGDIQRPPFGKLAFWMLTVGAWVVFSHFGKHRGFGKGVVAEWKAGLVSLVVSLPIALAFQLLVLVLAILAVLPIPRLRRALSALLLTLTGVLGDAYVLIENPLQRAAIVARTRRSLQWLAERCRKVMVLAHSQGGGVAYHAVREDAPENLECLLTFGSGLQKLEEIEQARRLGVATTAAVMAPLTLVLIGLLTPALLGPQVSELAKLGLWTLAAFAALAFLYLHLTVRAHWMNYGTELAEVLARFLMWLTKRTGWVDVFATHDPVPNGALLRPDASPFAPLGAEIVNRRSVLADHTTYWDNDAEFLPLVVDGLQRASGLTLIEAPERAVFEPAIERYRWCVRWLAVSRWVVAGAALVAAYVFAAQLAVWGASVLRALTSVPLGLDRLAGGTVQLVDSLASWAGPRLGVEMRDAGLTVLGFLLPATVIVLLRMAFSRVWPVWARESVWQEFRYRPAARPRTVSLTALTGVAPAPVAAEARSRRSGRLVLDGGVIALCVAPLVSILFWRFADLRQTVVLVLYACGVVGLGGLLVNAVVPLLLLKKQGAEELRGIREQGVRGVLKLLSLPLTALAFFAVLLSFVPGQGAWLGTAILYGIGVLILCGLAIAGWVNLVGRFPARGWKALAIALPVLASGTLSALALLKSDASPAGLAAVPVFGWLIGMLPVWLIAAVAERRRRTEGPAASVDAELTAGRVGRITPRADTAGAEAPGASGANPSRPD